MRKVFLFVSMIIAAIFVTPFLYTNAQVQKHIKQKSYQEGDIIFQSANSRQCEAVKLATHSEISHCGILFKEGNTWNVLEAVEPVQVVPLASWIARGEDGHYTIKRLKKEHNLLDNKKLTEMYHLGKSWIGKHYDIYFNWSNEQIYCSELVWKLYHEGAEIDLCSLRKLKEFDLDSPLVKQMMRERYGKNIPLDEYMIAPSDLYDSKKLELIEEK